ncbi:ATP-dependent endonuclease [Actinobacillus equuli subsp. haemolyticus]|uniref:ATP-dependent nuclease n=1 Tax=Actinobacillus equuli TaxID=718 RepID=UPI002442B23B|nr:ATP-dependent endonuclease [Actinobacillus equuli]WGE63310.1 ATP-dependent endonuclease [Actinobacillus equuli subsp. haemolyticus]WGE75497.1 ATP-dependent endonuclease [Actinobacillus equuli subsp. haemolyticus]WGE77401.1 ATP-dependent endonuclease [Actinobacillus equuli subsp. haemolyticus]
MKISQIKIKNFRKLKNCTMNLSNQTLFVGANNSGKTSAMHALMFFLGNKHREFKITDFSIDYWKNLNEIGDSWLQDNIDEHLGSELNEWHNYCPNLCVTLSEFVSTDLPRIKHLLPSLSWKLSSSLYVSLIYEPKDLNRLKADFVTYIKQVKESYPQKVPSLLPTTLKDFLEENINSYFSIQAYLCEEGNESNLYQLSDFPFDGIFKLSLIPAQRKFADSTDIDSRSNNLSDELSKFYDNHFDFKKLPSVEDAQALLAIQDLQDKLTSTLSEKFKEPLDKLKGLGYPSANYDPEIKLESFIDSSDILKRNTKVKFGSDGNFALPEELNGLGYRNLIYIFFKLLSFRAEWQRQGKASNIDDNDLAIEPIHLVLIEEPEAHLHSQVQQVFVKKAYEILTQGLSDGFSTQLIISTHSSYITHEIGFENLHYFKRTNNEKMLCSEAMDLSKVFNENEIENKKFVSRYLRTVHCDLFFANAIILVEGSAERMLLPYFIRHYFPKLHSSYISILEVNGAHAHRFKPLIEALGVPCLVLTDLDSVDQAGKKAKPKRGEGQTSNCDNLTHWLSLSDRQLEIVLDYADNCKVVENTFISYQKEICIDWNGNKETVIPYTFEDSIVFSNLKLFQDVEKMKGTTGMLKKMHQATRKPDLDSCCNEAFTALSGEKAKMVLDILYTFDPKEEKFNVPNYIEIGLNWLNGKLGLNN